MRKIEKETFFFLWTVFFVCVQPQYCMGDKLIYFHVPEGPSLEEDSKGGYKKMKQECYSMFFISMLLIGYLKSGICLKAQLKTPTSFP